MTYTCKFIREDEFYDKKCAYLDASFIPYPSVNYVAIYFANDDDWARKILENALSQFVEERKNKSQQPPSIFINSINNLFSFQWKCL